MGIIPDFLSDPPIEMLEFPAALLDSVFDGLWFGMLGVVVGYNFRPVNREQQFLLPENMTDWLPGDHLAWFVIDLVETLDLRLFLARYRADGWGAAAFHPRVMLALLVYSYCDGERSSRRIEDRCRTDAAYRVLVAGQIPDHTTIARFRAQHEAAIAEMFVQVLRVCLQAGMGRLGRVALDGTKAAAPASSRANKTVEAIDRELEKIAAQILAEAAAADLEEDTLFGPQQADPGRLPGRLRQLIRRRDRLIRAKQPVEEKNAAAQADYQRRIAERAAKEAATGKKIPGRKPAPPTPDPTAKVNVTDPDSRLMKSVHRFLQGFNGQAVAAEDQLVIAADVVNDENDLAQLHPMIGSAQHNLRRAGCDQPIGRLLADAGYPTEKNLTVEAPEMPDLLIALRKDQKTRAGTGKPLNEGPPPAQGAGLLE